MEWSWEDSSEGAPQEPEASYRRPAGRERQPEGRPAAAVSGGYTRGQAAATAPSAAPSRAPSARAPAAAGDQAPSRPAAAAAPVASRRIALRLSNFPKSWVVPEVTLPHLSSQVDELVKRFGKARKPVVNTREDGTVTVTTEFAEEQAATSAARTLHGADNSFLAELLGEEYPMPEDERLVAELLRPRSAPVAAAAAGAQAAAGAKAPSAAAAAAGAPSAGGAGVAQVAQAGGDGKGGVVKGKDAGKGLKGGKGGKDASKGKAAGKAGKPSAPSAPSFAAPAAPVAASAACCVVRLSAPPSDWSHQDVEELCRKHGAVDTVMPANSGDFEVTYARPEAAEAAALALHELQVPGKSDVPHSFTCELLPGDGPRPPVDNTEGYHVVAGSQVHGDIAGKGLPTTIFADELQLLSGDARPSDKEVFLRNIPIEDYTQVQLLEWLRVFGATEDVVFLKDPVSGGLSGGAYVRFAKHQEAASLLSACPGDASGTALQASWSLSERVLRDSVGQLRTDICAVLASEYRYLQARTSCSALALLGDSRPDSGRLRFVVWMKELTDDAVNSMHTQLADLLAMALAGPAAPEPVQLSAQPTAPVRAAGAAAAEAVDGSEETAEMSDAPRPSSVQAGAKEADAEHAWGYEGAEAGASMWEEAEAAAETWQQEHAAPARVVTPSEAPSQRRGGKDARQSPKGKGKQAVPSKYAKEEPAEDNPWDFDDSQQHDGTGQEASQSAYAYGEEGETASEQRRPPAARGAKAGQAQTTEAPAAGKEGEDEEEEEDEEVIPDDSMRPCILIQGFPNSWRKKQIRQVFALYGGVKAMQIVEDPIGRAARIELKDPRKMAVATEQLNNNQVGDGDSMEQCILQAELFGGEDMPEQLESLGPMRRTLFLDELPMPKRPDVGPGDRDREVYFQQLPGSVCREDQLREWAERFGPVDEALLRKDDFTGASTGTAYVRFSAHDGAVACVEACGSTPDLDAVASWSEAERAAQRSQNVYRQDLTLAFAEPSGRLLRSVLVRCKVNELWMQSEAIKVKDVRAPQPAAKQLHFSVVCEAEEFEEVKAALGNVLEAFHEKASQRLRSLPPPRKASGTPGPPPGWRPAPALDSGSKGKGKGKWVSGAADAKQPAVAGWVAAPNAAKEPPSSMLAKSLAVQGKGKGGHKSQEEAAQGPEPVVAKTIPPREAPGKAQSKGGSKAGKMAPRIGQEAQDGGRKRKWEGGPGVEEESFNQGEALMAEARAAAARGQRSAAYTKYCQGLEFLMECVPPEEAYDEESIRRREQIASYMHEAEALKAEIDRAGPPKAAGTPEKSASGAQSKGSQRAAMQGQVAILRARVDECEAVMRGAHDLEAQGLQEDAYKEYCRGLRNFLQFTRKLGEEAADKDALTKQAEIHLAKAPKLKERMAKAGITAASLLTAPSRQSQQQQQQARRSRSPARRPANVGGQDGRPLPGALAGGGPRPPMGPPPGRLNPRPVQQRQMAPRNVPAQEGQPEGAQPGVADRGRGKDNAAVSKAASLQATAPVKAAPGQHPALKRLVPYGSAAGVGAHGAASQAPAVAWGTDGIPPRPSERQDAAARAAVEHR